MKRGTRERSRARRLQGIVEVAVLAVLAACRDGYEPAGDGGIAEAGVRDGALDGGGPLDGGTGDADPDASSLRDGGAGPGDATPDAVVDESDAALDARAGDAGSARCLGDADCQDGAFCNGRERCAPSEPTADARGCVAATEARCLPGQTCDEARGACASDCAISADADADGHDALGCGGDDCDDSRADAFPGAPERCNGLDESCDGLADDGATLCRDPGTMASCTAGRCVISGCASPQADCNALGDDGCEVDLRSSADHCGACGTACGPGASCSMGRCDTGAAAVASGRFHSCALRLGGAVVCWGSNGRGELGRGAGGGSSLVPVLVTGLADAASLSAGGATTCVVRFDGTAACWGAGDSGQLGDGRAAGGVESPSPVPVVELTGATSISVGGEHACARLADGTVHCWGRNLEGQLGNGTTVPTGQPVAVAGLAGVRALAAGGRHSCALRDDGHVLCWGSNDEGQLGDGLGTLGVISTRPVEVAGLADAVEVAAGDRHTCARRSDGTLRCWGNGESGQLGHGEAGSGVFEPAPVAVVGVTGAAALAVGNRHGCAVSGGGVVVCWGAAAEGVLGDGMLPPPDGIVRAPVVVRDLSGAVALSAGERSTCARLGSGALRCWGRNAEGQLGDGTGIERVTPVAVEGFP